MAALFLAACGKDAPPTGAQIEVVNGDGVTAPRYLLFDWRDSDSVLVQNRRVPDTGFLDPNARPLAVVRIAAEMISDPQRRIVIRGMVGEQVVSQGEGAVQIVQGSWQTATVVLAGSGANPPADGGAPPDAGQDDGGAAPDGGDDQATDDAAPDLPADTAPLPADASAVDLAPDLPGPDLPHDLATPDVPAAPTVVAALADSYAEQGGSTSGMNFGKATLLEVKSQGGGDNNRIAFVRFSLASLAGGTPLTATLRLYGKASSGTSMVSAYAVTDEAWTESGITWNNKPALGTKLSTLSVGTTGQYREWNVTAFVKMQAAAGRDNVNFALSMDNDTPNSPDTYNSRENTTNQPQLVITR